MVWHVGLHALVSAVRDGVAGGAGEFARPLVAVDAWSWHLYSAPQQFEGPAVG